MFSQETWTCNFENCCAENLLISFGLIWFTLISNKLWQKNVDPKGRTANQSHFLESGKLSIIVKGFRAATIFLKRKLQLWNLAHGNVNQRGRKSALHDRLIGEHAFCCTAVNERVALKTGCKPSPPLLWCRQIFESTTLRSAWKIKTSQGCGKIWNMVQWTRIHSLLAVKQHIMSWHTHGPLLCLTVSLVVRSSSGT